ncbi:MAG: alpha/beta hydrolase [Treponema sp.]|nr:alpha/beta hydrolase [Treponema sp.]
MKKNSACLLFICSTIAFFSAFVQPSFASSKGRSEKIYLWDGIPKMETQKRDTVLHVFPPSKKNESDTKNVPAVIICPGGSYHHLGMKHEGFDTARWFASKGFLAFVLQYRVAYNAHHFPDQLADFQRAIFYIRKNHEKFGIDKNRIGAIGFSAGGHLVTMAAEFAERNQLNLLGIKEIETNENLRPDFVMPIYPVVSMQDDIAHKWSRKSLLGHQYSVSFDEKNFISNQFSIPTASKKFSLFNIRGFKYSEEIKSAFSMENPKNVPSDMPPVFLLACEDDPVVLYENSVRLEKTLSECGVNHVFVNFPKGGHGFGMNPKSYAIKTYAWNEKNLLPWLVEIGVLK